MDGGGALGVATAEADSAPRIHSVPALNRAIGAPSHHAAPSRRHPRNFLRALLREYGDLLSRECRAQAYSALRSDRMQRKRRRS